MIKSDTIAQSNDALAKGLAADYAALGEQLDRRGIDIAAIKAKVAGYGVAIPSWGVGTGGTRFARFPDGLRHNPTVCQRYRAVHPAPENGQSACHQYQRPNLGSPHHSRQPWP